MGVGRHLGTWLAALSVYGAGRSGFGTVNFSILGRGRRGSRGPRHPWAGGRPGALGGAVAANDAPAGGTHRKEFRGWMSKTPEPDAGDFWDGS